MKERCVSVTALFLLLIVHNDGYVIAIPFLHACINPFHFTAVKPV